MEISPFFATNGLFSSHYLNERLPKSPLFADANEADAVLAQLRAVYANVKNALPTGNEEDVEDRLVAPVLNALGYGFEKRRVLSTGAGGKQFPDFLLYASPAEGTAAFQSKDFYTHTIGLLEAKRWGVPLETPATIKSRSPHLQLRDYLNERKQIAYGIVTNGSEWRLYAQSAPASESLCIELAAILDAPDTDSAARFAFRLF